MKVPQVVVLTCNWNAYNALETAGAQRLSLPPGVQAVKVMCLGQVSPGLVLKAFESGADGVLLLGCPPGRCHFESGDQRAETMFAEARRLAHLLGKGANTLKFERLAAGDGQGFAKVVRQFAAGLDGKRRLA